VGENDASASTIPSAADSTTPRVYEPVPAGYESTSSSSTPGLECSLQGIMQNESPGILWGI
jgi:hypothetical protein